MSDDALARLFARIREESLTTSLEAITFTEASHDDWRANAKRWDVTPDARLLSDGRPDLRNAQVIIGGARATLAIAGDADLRGATIRLVAADTLVVLGSACRLNLVNLEVTGPRGIVAIGAETTWQSGACQCHEADQYVLFGDDCMLADQVLVRTNDGHGIFDRTTKEKINPASPVVLESHVWIGRRSTVNKGTRVGAGTVVGGDSVVSGQLDRNCIYAGIPARKLRDDVVWSRSQAWHDIPERFR